MALEQIIIYLIKVSISITLFYGLHMLLLQRETFFKLRRAFFGIVLVFSIVYPAITIGWGAKETVQPTTLAYILSEIEILVSQDTANQSSSESVVSPLLVALAIISLGTIILLGRLCIQSISFFMLLKKKKYKCSRQTNKIKIIELEDKTIPSLSFFNIIILNSHEKTSKQKSDILKHEMAHAKQFHSVDVLLYELFSIFFWWNPFTWLIKKEVKLNLEYLADAYAIKDKESYTDYQYTLLQISSASTGVAFINNFNVSHLKKRMMMMNKKRSPMLRIAKLLLVFPMTTLLVFSNTKAGESKELVNEEDYVATTLNLTEPQKNGKIYDNAVKMPSFPNGDVAMMKFVADNINYPKEAAEAKKEGKVLVQFIINTDGHISNALVLQGVHPLLETEAVRIVQSMPNWTPGELGDGTKVPVYFSIPITFRLK